MPFYHCSSFSHGNISRLCPCVGQSCSSSAQRPFANRSFAKWLPCPRRHRFSGSQCSPLFRRVMRTEILRCRDAEEQGSKGHEKTRHADAPDGCSRRNRRIPIVKRGSFSLMEFAWRPRLSGESLHSPVAGVLALCLPGLKGVSN